MYMYYISTRVILALECEAMDVQTYGARALRALVGLGDFDAQLGDRLVLRVALLARRGQLLLQLLHARDAVLALRLQRLQLRTSGRTRVVAHSSVRRQLRTDKGGGRKGGEHLFGELADHLRALVLLLATQRLDLHALLLYQLPNTQLGVFLRVANNNPALFNNQFSRREEEYQ